jgi:PST family polysaccharide transporter
VRGAGYAGVGFVLAQGLTLAFYLVLARLATPEDFGEFTAASVVVTTGILFAESGTLAALIHRKDRVDEAASTAVVSTAIAGVLFGLLALALSPLVGAFFESDRVGSLAAVMSGLLFIRSLQIVPEAMLQRRFSFLRRMIIEPAQVIAFGVVAIVACSNGMGPWGLVLGFYASAVTDVLLSWALVRWRPHLRDASFELWKELISYGRHVLASTIVLRAGEQVPKLLIGRWVGEAPLGQYRYGDRIALTPFSLVVSAASYVLFPAYARISHDPERFRPAFAESLRWFSAMALPLSLILVPLGVPLAVVAFGDVWREAGYVAMILSAWALGGALESVASEAYKALGHPERLTRTHTVTAVVGTAAMVAMLPLGLYGVVAGASIGVCAGAAYALVKLAPYSGVSVRETAEAIRPPAVAAVVMAGATLALELFVVDAESHGTALALLLIAGEALFAAAVYAGLLHLLAPGTATRLRELIAHARDR